MVDDKSNDYSKMYYNEMITNSDTLNSHWLSYFMYFRVQSYTEVADELFCTSLWYFYWGAVFLHPFTASHIWSMSFVDRIPVYPL
jgi:hypothetical protein